MSKCAHYGDAIICVSTGRYVGQVRAVGCRRWETITRNCKTAESAFAIAVRKMKNYKRARVLFIDDSGYYEPNLVMEGNRL